MALDLSDGGKHVRTRDGREVLIYNIAGGGTKPIHGAIRDCDGEWIPQAWWRGAKVRYVGEHPLDLIPYTPTEQWLIEVPAGQTPICFCPTGEVRSALRGERYIDGSNHTTIHMADSDMNPAIKREILTAVTARRAP